MENGALVLREKGSIVKKEQIMMRVENPMINLTTGRVNKFAKADNLIMHSNTEIPPKVMEVIREALEFIEKWEKPKGNVIFKGKIFKFCCGRRMYEIVLPIPVKFNADRAVLVCGQCGHERDHVHYYDF